MAKIFIAKRVIDYIGLGARGIPEGTLPLDETLSPVLALLQGMGADGAKLVNVDANGNLQITLGAAIGNQDVVIKNRGSATEADVISPADALGAFNGVAATTEGEIFNGALWDRVRSASAANLAAQSGLGAALAAQPGQWTVVSTPGAGVQASAVKAAGAAGVRHICTGITFSAVAAVAPVATVLTINIRDGASGAGTILKTYIVFISAAIGEQVPPIDISGMGLVGSAATAMTAEWSALLANLQQTVTLVGYDAS